MAKKLPLIRRLTVAISETSSNEEKGKIYGLVAKIAKEAVNMDQEQFYSSIDHHTLDYNNGDISEEDIKQGKELSNLLSNSINLPNPGQSKEYRKKMIAAMKIEYNLLKDYVSTNF